MLVGVDNRLDKAWPASGSYVSKPQWIVCEEAAAAVEGIDEVGVERLQGGVVILRIDESRRRRFVITGCEKILNRYRTTRVSAY